METVLIFTAAVIAALILAGGSKIAGDCSREEERNAAQQAEPADASDDCLRWSECNGVDGSCPLRKQAVEE